MNVSLPSVFYQADGEHAQHTQQLLTQSCHSFDVTKTTDEVYFGLVTDTKSLLVASLYSDEGLLCIIIFFGCCLCGYLANMHFPQL